MRAVLLSLLLLAAPSVEAQEAPAFGDVPPFAGVFALPYIQCDCDTSSMVFRTTREISGYATADASGPVIRTVAAGRFIESNDLDGALSVVVRPALAVALDTISVPAHRYGRVRMMDGENTKGTDVRLALAAGDRVEFLIEDPGYGFYRVGEVVYGMPLGILEDDPRVAWEHDGSSIETWLHLTPKPGRRAAWILAGLLLSDEPSAVRLFCTSPTGMRADCNDSDG